MYYFSQLCSVIGENDMTTDYVRKPEWLKIKLNTNEEYTGLKKMMREKKLHTVCEEAKCPNIHECWAVT